MSFYYREPGAKYDVRTMFLKFVHNTSDAVKWVDKKGIKWTHAVIYNRRTKTKVNTIKNIN